MKGAWRVPAGFAAERRGRAVVLLDEERAAPLRAAGLADDERWRSVLAPARRGRGRGGTAVVRWSHGALRLKPLRRGGLVAPLWRDRFVGRSRLLDNLLVPREARAREVTTPRAWALLAIEGPPGLHRGWLAVEEIAGAVDLAARCETGPALSGAEWDAALALVRRMHDVGLDHRDLNLGNLLLRDEGGRPLAWVVDLDRARLVDHALDFDARQRALRRLERSYVKTCRERARADVRDRIYAAYAGADAALADKLHRGRSTGRWWIRLHALGWRRSAS